MPQYIFHNNIINGGVGKGIYIYSEFIKCYFVDASVKSLYKKIQFNRPRSTNISLVTRLTRLTSKQSFIIKLIGIETNTQQRPLAANFENAAVFGGL